MKKRIEILEKSRVFTINRAESGQGNYYGVCYFPKELVGVKFIIAPLSKEQIKKIKKFKKSYILI